MVDPQKPSLVQKFLDTKPKRAKVVSRRIVTRGEMEAAQLDKTESSDFTVLEVGNAEVVEKLHVGIPSEPEISLSEQCLRATLEVSNSFWIRRWKTC